MDVKKREEESTQPKLDKLNNSETEFFKSSPELKLMDIFMKNKVENSDRNSKLSKKSMTEVKERSEINPEDDEEMLDINDDDNVKIEKKSIKIEKTTVAEVLKESKLDEKENFNLLKINLNFLAKKQFKWVVYRTPSETQKFFKKLYNLVKNDDNAAKLGFVSSLEKLKDYKESEILNSLKEINDELDKMLQSPYFENNLQINEFLNIGGSSFSQYNKGVKPFEGWGLKKADPHCFRKVFGYICICLECCIFKKYNERWIVLKDDMITYSDLSVSSQGKHVYFFDKEIKAVRNGKLSITITNLSRVLELKFKTYFERELWKREIEERIKKFKQNIINNKYKAFTNEKMNNFAYWFIDGKDYFLDLYEKLMGARTSIFITDWWMSPEVWLKRPIFETDFTSFLKKKNENSLTRLMDILEYKAKKGVKIYILLYYECSLAIKLNSKHTQDTLEKLHKNIVVTRHPANKFDLLWSHHEKLVIIDQAIGYVGGLDLCWGRYDSNEHPIYEGPNLEKKYYFPFIDYSNARICDFVNVENYLVESVPRETSLRMPWHDIHTRLIGPVVNDITRHFVERWNHARYEDRNQTSLNMKKNTEYEYEQTEYKKRKTLKAGGFLDSILQKVEEQMNKEKNNEEKNENDNTPKANNPIQEEDSFSLDIDDKDNIRIGTTPAFSNKINSLKALGIRENNINNNNTRKNNNNIHTAIENAEKINNLNICLNPDIKQWKTHQETKERESILVVDEKLESIKKKWMKNFKDVDEDHFLVPKKLDTINTKMGVPNPVPENKKKKSFYSELVNKIKKNKNNWFKDLFKVNNEIETIINDKYVKKGSVPSNVQVLRSVGEWSLGLRTTECSILEAYYQLIENSRHYIYIENQFFISKSFEDDNNKQYLVENKIALYIRNRILKACKNREKFRVYVFIPLLPGFAGEPQKSGILQIILKYTYESICRNNGLSIIEKLKEELEKIGQNWEDYIGFYSLRNHSLVNGIPKTEIVYIHSKLMIVDDLYVICGSANINDRSMKGSRDSEFAALIKEKRTEISTINGKKYRIAKFASSLRKAIMSEHLGINKHDKRLEDPVSDELHELIKKTAHTNTFYYHQIFGCYPDDCYTKFSMIPNKVTIQNKSQENYLIHNYNENKHKIVGHIVEFPLHFLEDEELGISFFSKENLVPERNFT